MHSEIPELLQRIVYVLCAFLLSHAMRLYGCRRRQTLYCRTTLGLPFASCPGWETIKVATVLMAAVVAAEYKTNDHFVRRGSKILNGGTNSKLTRSESKVRLQLVNVK